MSGEGWEGAELSTHNKSPEGREQSSRDPGSGRSGVLIPALALSLGVAVALGFARFAYALLLPVMQTDLGWSYALAGGMNAANTAGYLFGALACAPVMARIGTRRSFAGALLITALSLLFSGVPSAYYALAVLRFASGAAGAVVFIAGGVLASHLASADTDGSGAGRPAAGTVLAVYFGGGGLGILASGLGVPALLELGSVGAWRWAWAALGAASLLALIPAARASSGLEEPPGKPATEVGGFSALPLLPTFFAYFLFALGYIAYMTFSVALLAGRGAGVLEISLFWAVLGISGVASAFLWGVPIEHLRGGQAPALILAVVAVGAILPLLSDSAGFAFASAVLFGGSFLAVATVVTTVARRSLPVHAWSSAIAALTVVFAAGQCFGPVVSGALSDAAGGLQTGLALSAGVLAVSVVVALFQRDLSSTTGKPDADNDTLGDRGVSDLHSASGNRSTRWRRFASQRKNSDE